MGHRWHNGARTLAMEKEPSRQARHLRQRRPRSFSEIEAVLVSLQRDDSGEGGGGGGLLEEDSRYFKSSWITDMKLLTDTKGEPIDVQTWGPNGEVPNGQSTTAKLANQLANRKIYATPAKRLQASGVSWARFCLPKGNGAMLLKAALVKHVAIGLCGLALNEFAVRRGSRAELMPNGLSASSAKRI